MSTTSTESGSDYIAAAQRFPNEQRRIQHPTDPTVWLLVPEHDEPLPEVSIVVPALDEEITIADFVSWCHEGLAKAGICGEILIVDSSTDRTTEIALAGGARVLRCPKRGLGRAYIDSIPMIRGEFVIMGDADCTYDFRQLDLFVAAYKDGYEYAMGSRWKGSIESGAMPFLHRYLGTPVTTWILNVLFSSDFSDIHCGMRGIRTDSLKRMQLRSQSWEYASEMVLKSVHMKLRRAEIPVRFLKDREGRMSHHKRMGWTSPFKAAWINLRAMFIYGADFFLVKPGLVLLCLGLLLTLPLSFGPVTLGPVQFSIYWMLLGLTLTVFGIESVYLGLLARTFYDFNGETRKSLGRIFSYDRGVGLGVLGMAAGFACGLPLLWCYVRNGFLLSGSFEPWNFLAVTGATLALVGFSTFTFTLVLHAALLPRWSDDV